MRLFSFSGNATNPSHYVATEHLTFFHTSPVAIYIASHYFFYFRSFIKLKIRISIPCKGKELYSPNSDLSLMRMCSTLLGETTRATITIFGSTRNSVGAFVWIAADRPQSIHPTQNWHEFRESACLIKMKHFKGLWYIMTQCDFWRLLLMSK